MKLNYMHTHKGEIMNFEELENEQEEQEEQEDTLQNVSWNQMKIAIIVGIVITFVLVSPIIWIASKIGN